MTKTFKEVFPTLKLDKDMENLLETADVTRISVNHARDFYKIYVKAKRLIFKKNIWKLEESIKKQIFKSKDITVKIIESYELSSQYTPKTLFDVYFDSILDEINSHSVLLYNLLRTSKWSFTDDTHVTVTLEETIIAKTRGNSIIEFLEKVFCERCGMDFIVKLQYEKPKISKYRQNADTVCNDAVNSQCNPVLVRDFYINPVLQAVLLQYVEQSVLHAVSRHADNPETAYSHTAGVSGDHIRIDKDFTVFRAYNSFHGRSPPCLDSRKWYHIYR